MTYTSHGEADGREWGSVLHGDIKYRLVVVIIYTFAKVHVYNRKLSTDVHDS